TSVASVHYSLSNVDSCAGYSRPVVNIHDLIDRPTVHAHPKAKTRISLQRAANFQGTLNWLLRTFEKRQRHPIPGRNGNQFSPRLTFAELCGFSHQLIELLHHLALLTHKQLGITDHIQKQNMPSGKMWI